MTSRWAASRPSAVRADHFAGKFLTLRSAQNKQLQWPSINPCQLTQFDHVYSSLPRFDLGNEGLRAFEPVSNFDLGQPGVCPGLFQFPQELRVAMAVAGIFQGRWIMASRTSLSQN
jgi:hypothetical protein